MTAGTGNGLGTAVELLGGFGDLGLGEGEQPELFADADDAPGPLAPVPAPAKRPAHRPKGSRNRSTEEWRQFVLGRHRSPLLVLAETWSRSADELARELGLVREVQLLAPGQQALKTLHYGEDHPKAGQVRAYVVWDRLEAFRVQQGAAVAALPYLHQKQPMALEVKQTTRGVVILGSLDVDDGGDGDGFGLPLAPEQNQQVIDVEPEKSHGSQSHDAPNPLEYRDE